MRLLHLAVLFLPFSLPPSLPPYLPPPGSHARTPSGRGSWLALPGPHTRSWRHLGREGGREGGRTRTDVVGPKEELTGEVALLDPVHVGHVHGALLA